jgi:hypothetical protein
MRACRIAFGAELGSPRRPAAVSSDSGEIRFAAVDDGTNTLDVWTFQQQLAPPSPGGHSQGPGNQPPTLAPSLAALQQHKIDVIFSNPDLSPLA